MFNVDLTSVLEEPTVIRSEVAVPKNDVPDDFSGLEFEEPNLLQENEDAATELDLMPYDAAENAEILVELLDTFNTAALTPLARWKLTKKRGGKNAILRMQEIAEKNFTGAELNEQEKRLLFQYNAYLKDKEELEEAIPYTVDEKERLIKAAIPYMKKSKIRIGGGMAFWTELALIQGTRIMQVLTA